MADAPRHAARARKSSLGGSPEETLARLVLEESLAVESGESVAIETWAHALPWARPFVWEARRLGADPSLIVEDEAAFFRSLAIGRRRHLPNANPAHAATHAAYVYLGGPEAFPRLLGLPSRDFEAIVRWQGPAWWRAARRSGLRAANLAIAGVTETAADRFGVDPSSWRRDVLRASLVPPSRLARSGEAVLADLRPGRRLAIRHANGTEIHTVLDRSPPFLEDGRVDAADRRSGRFWTQVPSGLLAVPLRPGATEGTWETNRPVYDRFSEPSVSVGARFVFDSGRLREFSFDRGGESFAAALGRQHIHRAAPALVTIGLNPEIGRTPELGELAAGAIGLWIGAGPPAVGGERGRFSYLSTLDGADVELDGRPWFTAGRATPRRRR